LLTMYLRSERCSKKVWSAPTMSPILSWIMVCGRESGEKVRRERDRIGMEGGGRRMMRRRSQDEKYRR
jgi:hypothetical protein